MRNRTRLVSLTVIALALGALAFDWPLSQASAGDQEQTNKREPARSAAASKGDPTTADKAIANAVAKARRSCQAACDSENGQCNSDVRRSRQECSKDAANGGNNPFSGRPEAFDYYCGYFEIADCRSRACAERVAQRYTECVQFMRGDVTSRRFNCIRAESRAQSLCRLELRDCRAQCE